MHKWVNSSLGTVAALMIATLITHIWLPFFQSLRIIVGGVGVLFLPGFVWTRVIWSSTRLGGAERIIYSVVLSMILVPIGVYSSYRLSIPFSEVTVLGILFIIIISGVVAIQVQKIHS